MRWIIWFVPTVHAAMFAQYSLTSTSIYLEEDDTLPFTGLAATTNYISWTGDASSSPSDATCDGEGSNTDLDADDASAEAGATKSILNLAWSDTSFIHFKFLECDSADEPVDETQRVIQITAGTRATWNNGAHNKFVLTTKNGGATPTQVEFHFDLGADVDEDEYIYLQTVEDRGDGFGVAYRMWAAAHGDSQGKCTADADENGADDVYVRVTASTASTYDTLRVKCPASPTADWDAGVTMSIICTSNLQPNPNPKTDFKIAAISHTTTDLAKTISYQNPALDPVAGAGNGAAWYVLTTDPTALTGGGMVPNTLVAGRVPTSSVLTLGVVTPLANTQTIVCTFSQAVWSGDVTSNPAVSGGSSTATAAATSSGAVITMTVTRAFPAATYTFTFTDNLGANYATGAVTSNCSSTQDVTLLSGTAFTTTAATKVDWTIGGGNDGYAKPTGTGRFNTGITPATYDFKFDVSASGALVSGNTIVLKAVRGGSAVKIWNSAAAVTCGTLTEDGSAFSASSIAASASTGSTFDTLTITLSSGIGNSATVIIICSSNIAANAAASAANVSMVATTSADTAVADSKADTSGGSTAEQAQYFWTITAVTSVDWTIAGADSGYAKPDAGANSKKTGFTPANFSFSFDVSEFGSLVIGDTIVLTAVRDGAAIKVWNAAGAVTCGTLTQDRLSGVFNASSIVASASTGSTFDTLTITLGSGIGNYATVVIVCTSNIAANAAANSNYVSFGATTTCDTTSSNSYNGGATGYSYVITATPAPTPAPTTPAPTPAPTTAPPEPTPDAIEDALESVNQTDLDVVAADYGLPGNITLGAVTTTSTTVVFTCEACGTTAETFNETDQDNYRGVIANISEVNLSQVAITAIRNVSARRRRRLLSSSCPGTSIDIDTVITSLASLPSIIISSHGDEFPTTMILLIVGGVLLMFFIVPSPHRRRGFFYGPLRLR